MFSASKELGVIKRKERETNQSIWSIWERKGEDEYRPKWDKAIDEELNKIEWLQPKNTKKDRKEGNKREKRIRLNDIN